MPVKKQNEGWIERFNHQKVGVKAAIVSGVFLIIVACIGGVFGIVNTIIPLLDKTPNTVMIKYAPTDTSIPVSNTTALISTATQPPNFPSITQPPASQTFEPLLTLTNTPIACPHQVSDDLTTFTNLINAEADAANKADFQIIQEIFSPNAVIHDFNPERVWYSPTARYLNDLFKNTKIKGAQHFDIRIDDRSNSTQAWATSGNRGFYLGEAGVWIPYENPSATNPNVVSGSDHWTFGRNDASCWVIVQYEFNASQIPFP